MHVRLRSLARSCVLAASLVWAVPAAGQANWSRTPTGNWRYDTNFGTSGTFLCSGPLIYSSGSCTASGNTLTLHNGSAWMNLSFIGAAGSLGVTNEFAQFVEVGRIERSYGGTGPFVLPTTWSISNGMFHLRVQVNSSVPVAASTSFEVIFRTFQDGRAYYAGVPDRFGWETTPMPGTLGPRVVLWHDMDRYSTGTTLRAGETEPVVFTAAVSFVPEPSTWALMATGLLPLAWAVRHRGRAA